MILVLSAGVSWAYFAFAGFPSEIQRLEHGEYSVVAYASPTSRLSPLLMLGGAGLFNNTSISVALFRGDAKVREVRLLEGEDRPEYHLPLEAQWGARGVEIKEAHQGRSVYLEFPASDA